MYKPYTCQLKTYVHKPGASLVHSK